MNEIATLEKKNEIAKVELIEHEESEFGRGLVICLVKFAEHNAKLNQTIESYKKMSESGIPGGLFNESSAITMWANGATDHLYEIECPDVWPDVKAKVEELQNKGLDMGHGAGLMSDVKYTKKDAYELFNLTKEIAIMIDKKMGLSPEIGQW